MIYIIFFLLIIICVVLTFLLTKKTKLDKFIIEQNEELKKKNKELNIENESLSTTNTHLQEVKSTLHNQIENEKGIKFNLDIEIERSSSILKTLQEDNEKLVKVSYVGGCRIDVGTGHRSDRARYTLFLQDVEADHGLGANGFYCQSHH